MAKNKYVSKIVVSLICLYAFFSRKKNVIRTPKTLEQLEDEGEIFLGI